MSFGDEGRRTPIGTPLGMETPIVRIGGSVHTAKSPYMGGGMSPSFQTPIYPSLYNSQREFSEHNPHQDLPVSSPLLKTPLILNYSNTPILQHGLNTMSPIYNPGNTSYHGNSMHRPSSQIRSPSYVYQGGVSSSSPNYSSLRSQSPDYNSPMGSSGRYGNSPNYSPSPMEQNQKYFKDEEENGSEEEDDQ